jgi:hypothetical protein
MLLLPHPAMTPIDTILSQLSPALKGAGLVGAVAGVARAFKWFDAALSPDGRRKLSQWLKNVPGDDQIDAWSSVFPRLIDHVFGRTALSWKFFLRSCLASLISVTVVAVGFVIGNKADEFVRDFRLAASVSTHSTALVFIIVFYLAVNLIPDYLSILISRGIVRVMSRHSTPPRVTILLLLDIFLTLCLSIVSISIVIFANQHESERSLGWAGRDMLLDSIRTAIYLATREPFVKLSILASLFTSVWVWLYVVASVSIRILHSMRSVLVRLVPFLNIEKNPMVAIGRVAGVIAGFIYAVGIVSVWLFEHLK